MQQRMHQEWRFSSGTRSLLLRRRLDNCKMQITEASNSASCVFASVQITEASNSASYVFTRDQNHAACMQARICVYMILYIYIYVYVYIELACKASISSFTHEGRTYPRIQRDQNHAACLQAIAFHPLHTKVGRIRSSMHLQLLFLLGLSFSLLSFTLRLGSLFLRLGLGSFFTRLL